VVYGDEYRHDRPSIETSGRLSWTSPAGLAKAAVASSAKATKAPPKPMLRAPGLEKLNSIVVSTCPLAEAAVISTSRQRPVPMGVR
jgi:hypothetical protein